MVFKCKICGGELNISQGESVIECEYCGVKQTIPVFIDPKIDEMFDRSNYFLAQNEFDKAENILNQILLNDKTNAEVYWNLLLCKYGVSYVKDPASGKYIPTCNRTQYGSIFNDENYINAISFANEEKKRVYEQDAETIDNIQKGILAISQKEKPFDIFISYKETGSDKQRTKDSIFAQNLYEKLTHEGYKVFFSRITLEDKVGTEYEPYIYAALASSKIMLTISSCKENIEAVWVKNEWSRFLSFMKADSSKSLIPLYYDMPKSDLPDEFSTLPMYNTSEEGFEQELIRGIKKLIPLPVMLAEKRKKMRKHMAIASVALVAIIAIGLVAMIPWFNKNAEYKDAVALYDGGNYPLAVRSFEKMEGFRDSEEMIEKSELAWRKSVSTIATDNTLSSSSYGSYYISANGTVETFSYDSGTSNENISIDEHGKIISIGDNYDLFALHEDGYVDNFKDFEKYDNIIKISPIFNATPVALLSDGTMVYGKELYSQNGDNDEWLMEISSWKDIVDFNWYVSRYGYGGCEFAVIIGIKADGSLCMTAYVKPDHEQRDYRLNAINNAKNFISSLENVKSVECYMSSGYQKENCDIIALTEDDQIISYINGVQQSYEVKDSVDIDVFYSYETEKLETLVLDENGELSLLNGKSIMEGVVYVFDDFLVTRTGAIYNDITVGASNPNNTDCKTEVFEEWTLKNLIDVSYKTESSPDKNLETDPGESEEDKDIKTNSNLSKQYSNSDGISFNYPSNYTIEGDYESNGFVLIESKNGNSIFVNSPSITENSLIDMVKGEQTLQLPNGDMFRTVKVAEEAIVLESGETGYYFECVDIDGVYQIFFMAKKNGMLYSLIYNIKDEDAYDASIDEAKAIINTFKIEN